MRGVRRGRRETEMDGVKSLAVQGYCYRKRQFTDAHRRSEKGFGKMTSQEVGDGEIMSKDREEGEVFVCERDRPRPRGRKRVVYSVNLQRKRNVQRNSKIRRFREEERSRLRLQWEKGPSRNKSGQLSTFFFIHPI